ncbi:transposase [Escherichia coli]|nr:transposase [Escherichia coli]
MDKIASACRKIAFQLTRWLYLPHRAGILLSWFF